MQSGWTARGMREIIPFRRERGWGRLSLRRGNEHFSKRTKPGRVVSLRVHGDAAVDRGAVRRGDCGAGGDWRFWLHHADAHKPGPRGAAKTKQGSRHGTRPGQYAHRRPEEQDGANHTESRLDAVGTGVGQEPRGSDSQGSASIGPEADGAIKPGAERK